MQSEEKNQKNIELIKSIKEALDLLDQHATTNHATTNIDTPLAKHFNIQSAKALKSNKSKEIKDTFTRINTDLQQSDDPFNLKELPVKLWNCFYNETESTAEDLKSKWNCFYDTTESTAKDLKSKSRIFFERMSNKQGFDKGFDKRWFSIFHGNSYQTVGKTALDQINASSDASKENIITQLLSIHLDFIQVMKKYNSKRTWQDYQQTFFNDENLDKKHINSNNRITSQILEEIFKQNNANNSQLVI